MADTTHTTATQDATSEIRHPRAIPSVVTWPVAQTVAAPTAVGTTMYTAHVPASSTHKTQNAVFAKNAAIVTHQNIYPLFLNNQGHPSSLKLRRASCPLTHYLFYRTSAKAWKVRSGLTFSQKKSLLDRLKNHIKETKKMLVMYSPLLIQSNSKKTFSSLGRLFGKKCRHNQANAAFCRWKYRYMTSAF